jgi:hypothetical protein
MTGRDVWTYSTVAERPDIVGSDIVGFSVEASDGHIGTVSDATDEVGASRIVVDTGPWMFGKKVLIPAGLIERIDAGGGRVFVGRSKDEIKNAPEFDETRSREPAYREELSRYYGEARAAEGQPGRPRGVVG